MEKCAGKEDAVQKEIRAVVISADRSKTDGITTRFYLLLIFSFKSSSLESLEYIIPSTKTSIEIAIKMDILRLKRSNRQVTVLIRYRMTKKLSLVS